MYINILAKNEDVSAVREKVKSLLPDNFKNHVVLSIPVGSDSKEASTHKYCFFKVSKELHEKITKIQELTEIEISEPRSFLKKRGLYIIRNKH